jgi:hypothetical protein
MAVIEYLLSECRSLINRIGMRRQAGVKGASQAESDHDQSNGGNGNSQHHTHVNAPARFPHSIFDRTCLAPNEGNPMR